MVVNRRIRSGPTWPRPIAVRQLDGVGKPEVLLTEFTGGNGCCFTNWIYAGAKRIRAPWLNAADDPGRRRRRQAGVPRLRRNGGGWGSRAAVQAPVKVWTYADGAVHDVTRSFPAEVQADQADQYATFQRALAADAGSARNAMRPTSATATRSGRATRRWRSRRRRPTPASSTTTTELGRGLPRPAARVLRESGLHDLVLDPIAQHSLTPSELQALLAAERDGEPFFAFRNADDRLALFRAGPRRRADARPRPEMDLAIDWDEEVSGLHAELVAIGGEWTIVDDGLSTNGTFVNARRVAGRQRLRDGDRVRVGQDDARLPRGGRRRAGPADGGRRATAPPPWSSPTPSARCSSRSAAPTATARRFTSPATNQQIADELFLSVEAVKMHLRTLFGKFELGELPQNEKRTRLAECVLEYGVVTRQELG